MHKAPNKKIFNIKRIDTAKLSASFGLQNAPVIVTQKQEESESEDEGKEKLSKIQKLRLKNKMKKNDIKGLKSDKLVQQKK